MFCGCCLPLVVSLMTKDHLLELAWPQGEVAEESLTRCIYSLRKHLGADKGFIKTDLRVVGYRFHLSRER